MTLTEARTPPPEYLPDRNPGKVYAPRLRADTGFSPDLPDALYKDFARRWCAHDVWTLRHWRTFHNCHVEHWHGISKPGSAA